MTSLCSTQPPPKHRGTLKQQAFYSEQEQDEVDT